MKYSRRSRLTDYDICAALGHPTGIPDPARRYFYCPCGEYSQPEIEKRMEFFVNSFTPDQLILADLNENLHGDDRTARVPASRRSRGELHDYHRRTA